MLTWITTMLPTAAPACAARGDGASPNGVIFFQTPEKTSNTCTSLVAPANRIPKAPPWPTVRQTLRYQSTSACTATGVRLSFSPRFQSRCSSCIKRIPSQKTKVLKSTEVTEQDELGGVGVRFVGVDGSEGMATSWTGVVADDFEWSWHWWRQHCRRRVHHDNECDARKNRDDQPWMMTLMNLISFLGGCHISMTVTFVVTPHCRCHESLSDRSIDRKRRSLRYRLASRLKGYVRNSRFDRRWVVLCR